MSLLIINRKIKMADRRFKNSVPVRLDQIAFKLTVYEYLNDGLLIFE